MTTGDAVTAGVALVGDVDPELVGELGAAGLPVRGALAPDPFGPPVAGRRYASVGDLLADDGVRAVVLAPGSRADQDLLPCGLPVLLAAPAPWDADLLRAARRALAEADVAVAVVVQARHAAWTELVRGALEGRRGPVQVTVRGWPRGPVAAAELVDVLRLWCGEVVAAAALPAELPAERLPDGPPVVWALLTARGTTVLVAHEGEGPEVRLSLPPARLRATPVLVGWEGAAGVVPQDRPDPTVPAFAAAVRAGSAEPLEQAPGVASLADLVPVGRVLAALRDSARTRGWVQL